MLFKLIAAIAFAGLLVDILLRLFTPRGKYHSPLDILGIAVLVLVMLPVALFRKLLGTNRKYGSSAFAEATDSSVTPALVEFGFVLECRSIDKSKAMYIYSKGDQYILVVFQELLRDPTSCIVHLGEGQPSGPESSWNCFSLRELAQTEPGHPPVSFKDYEMTPGSTAQQLVDRFRGDLLGYATEFLQGDLSGFRVIRARINQSRTPACTITRDIDGTVTTEVDVDDAAMKERFCK